MNDGMERLPGVSHGRGWQSLELLLFVLLFLAAMTVPLPLGADRIAFVPVAVSQMFRDLLLLLVVFALVRRSGEGLAALGWRGVDLREAVVGLLLFIPVFLSAGLLEGALREAGLGGRDAIPAFLIPHGADQMLLGVLFVSVVAVAEETIFRGYLILRMGTITRSRPVAVALSTLLFAVGHGYQGAAGMVAVGYLGLMFALVYVWRGSLVAPVVMHFAQDFLGIIIAPLTGYH